jgi:WD40-like Beta Propeller Repeat
VVERNGGGWGEAKNLGPAVNSASDELFPSVTDLGVIYFGSDRPGGAGAWDIWRQSLSATAGAAENIGPAINTDGLEFNPWISPDGHLLLLTALNRPGGYGAGDLYFSVDLGAGFNPPVNLGPCVNTSADEYHAAPRLETGELFFARLHFDPVWIPGDLYVLDLRRLGASWLK